MGIIIFISILYLIVSSYFNKSQNSSQKKSFYKKHGYRNPKKIDSFFQFPKKELIYNHHFFSTKKVVITGELKYFKTRNNLAKLLWENGAIIEKIFNSSIDILIVGKSNIDSLKLKSAYYLNVKVITEEELLNYFPDFKPFLKESNSELQLN
ncbi:MAG: BRCT domain-containing protein [Flavobacteriaceae bacterium]|nr:BRCT domain-containing protein [Flavobacteriaceae bacterium]